MEAEPAENPIKDGVRLINEGIKALSMQQSILISPALTAMMQRQPHGMFGFTPQQNHALKIMQGIDKIIPMVERVAAESCFNPEIGFTTLKLLQEMRETTHELAFPRSSFSIIGRTSPHKDTLQNRLSSLNERLFSYLENISPHKGDPRNLIRESLETIVEIIQAPDMDGFMPEEQDSFGVKNLLGALSKTSMALWQCREKKRTESTPVESLSEPRERAAGPLGLDYSVETVEKGADWLQKQITDKKIVESVRIFCTPTKEDGSLDGEQQKQNLALIEQSAQFTINPDRDPVTLSIVQSIMVPSWLLRRLPESTLPPETLQSLKRPGDGFKPSDIARISQKVWAEISAFAGGTTTEEQITWSHEKQQLLREKTTELLTPANAQKFAHWTERGKDLFSSAHNYLHKIAAHVRHAQQKEDVALNPLRKLHKEDKKFHHAIDEEID